MSATGNTMDTSTTLVRKLWQYCNVLRDDGLSYPDYVEQLTYLLFLKMSAEGSEGPVPSEFGWPSLVCLEPEPMHAQYGRILATLGGQVGMLGLIFRNARNKIRDPAKLHLLVNGLIGQTEWRGLAADVKGDAYEGLLEKNAQDTKSGAGQYFTPRALIEAIVECIEPGLGETICDPACGTAGFLLAAHDHIRRKNVNMTSEDETALATRSIRGVELVEEVARLAAMNLLLHGVGGDAEHEFPVRCEDSLTKPPQTRFDIVLTNPPFGTKGSVTYGRESRGEAGKNLLAIDRPDFWVQTANKQLNFIQHVFSLLRSGGRAAIVVPDNVLFESGAATEVRRKLLATCRLRAVLRLPPGIFYAQGVKANVIFFEQAHNRSDASGTFAVYDLRTDVRVSLKTKPLRRRDLADFVTRYRMNFVEEAQEDTRFRLFSVKKVLGTRDCQLDLAWCDDGDDPRDSRLARLEKISEMVADDLTRALALIRDVQDSTRRPAGAGLKPRRNEGG